MSSSAFQPPEISELQKLLPAYGLEEFIAAGGMGAVYRARQLSLEREVAIKILPAEFLADGDLRAQFGEEARAMAKLNHANLIGIYDFGEVQGMPYLVMEYVSGSSLHDSSHGVAIDPEVALSIASGIARGLAHAHAAGIIHRDIKPANILLTKDAQPKIGDFGLARPLESENADAVVFGTPGYTAPEVLSDADLVGKQSDVFSVGVILYELLAGELPGDPIVPVSRKVRTPAQLDQVIRKATNPDPAQRYADATELTADLEKVAPLLKKATLLTGNHTTGQAGSPPTLQSAPAPLATGPAPTSPVATATLQSAGGDWHFLRNLVLIVALCGAIFGVWKAIQWKEAVAEKREREHRQKLALQQQIPTERERPPPEPDPDPIPDPDPPEPERTPLEQLADLKGQLRSGERSELPEGTHTQATQAYFVVEKDLTWAEAANFAEEHGGHLAVCSDSSLATWLAGKLPAGRKTWLGAGLTGPAHWGWVDGTKWSGTPPSRQIGNVLALSDLGTLLPVDASTRLPFVLQWDLGGGNPGTLDRQLARMEDTADTPNPVWPVGSMHRGTRHYLLIPRSVSLDKAESLAGEMGGHLAIPSDPPENDFLLEIASKLQATGESCWIGGEYSDGAWEWLTGEAWTKGFWSEGFPGASPEDGTGICLRAGTTDGWVTSDPRKDHPASFLVEWSPDHTYATNSSVDFDFEATEELLKLRKIAINAYKKHEVQYRKDLGDNRKDFLWDLDFWFNGLPGSTRERFGPGLRTFKARFDVPDPKVPLAVDFDLEEIPDDVRKILDQRLAEEKALEEAMVARFEKLRLAYLKQLTTKAGEFQEAGNGKEVAAFRNESSALGQDGDSLREYFEFLK